MPRRLSGPYRSHRACGRVARRPVAAAAGTRAGQQPPTFKVEVNYVEIDARVTDAQGTFVDDLTKDDFQIVEDGKPQTIACSRA